MINELLNIESVRVNNERNLMIILDQTRLPNEEIFLELKSKEEIFDAIVSLKVRGAPALGIAAAYGLCVVMKEYIGHSLEDFYRKAERVRFFLESARPTAVNPAIALSRIMRIILNAMAFQKKSSSDVLEMMFDEADSIKNEEIECSVKIAEFGIELLKPGWGILTHCNAGYLAAAGLGTALSPLYLANQRGYDLRIYAGETRPLLQGARLTAFELHKSGADVTLICDNSAALLMERGLINAVFVGCDRVASNGDVANKIGTSAIAVLASYYKIPFYVLGPDSTIDRSISDGSSIIVEERDKSEITEMWYKQRMAPSGVKVFNPAFDVTKAGLITAIVTESGIFSYPYDFK